MNPLEYYTRLEKVSTLGRSAQGDLREYEEMTPAKWKQTAKDLALGGLGVGVGYAAGRLIGGAITDEMVKSKKGWKMLKKYGPAVAAGATGLATLGLQARSTQHKLNREKAEKLHQARMRLRQLKAESARKRASTGRVRVPG